MENVKTSIETLLKNVANENISLQSKLTDTVYLSDYKPNNGIWTEAFQTALNEHEIVIIPSASEPYYIDSSVLIPSNRRIIAEKGATIRLTDKTKVLMLRNTNTADGTHHPITKSRNVNISIEGGRWEDWCPHRMGYGGSVMYDNNFSSSYGKL